MQYIQRTLAIMYRTCSAVTVGTVFRLLFFYFVSACSIMAINTADFSGGFFSRFFSMHLGLGVIRGVFEQKNKKKTKCHYFFFESQTGEGVY